MPAQAQESRDASQIQEVIVTARRTEERLQDVPISITVFNQEQLANRNIVSPVDLATYTPSLTTNQRYGPEKSSYVIRGFTQEAGTSPSVGVYFADVVAPRAMGGTTSGNGSGAGNLFDLQNVQVLKGPQGTLFGRNTTGGAVLLVPRKPTDRLEGYVEGTAGNYDLWRVQAVANIPINESIRVRLGVDRNKRDGYMKNHGVGPDLNDLNYTAARLSVVADITPDFENYTIFNYSNSDSNGYGAHMLACDPTAATSTDPNRTVARLLSPYSCAQAARMNAAGFSLTDVDEYNPDPKLELKTWQVINTSTLHATSNVTIKNIVSYAEFREDATFNLFGDNFIPPSGQTLPYIQLNPAPGRHNASQSTFTEELQIQGTALQDRLNWQAGVYLELSEPLGWSSGYTSILLRCADINTLQCTPPPEFGPLAPALGQVSYSATRTSFDNKGFYAQGTYRLTDKLAVTGGFRYTIDKTRAASETTRFSFPAPGVTTQVCTDTLRFRSGIVAGRAVPLVVTDPSQCHFQIAIKSQKPTWVIDLEYKPIEDAMLYAKYARGYRQGGINMTNFGLESWDPEKVDTYEVGAKTSFRAPVSGYFNITGFYNDFQDQQITANLGARPGSGVAGGTAIVNAGKSRIWGVEVDSAVNLFEGFRVELGYTYLNTKLLDIISPTLPPDSPFATFTTTAEEGRPLSFSPKNRVTLTASYELPLDDSIGQVALGATYTHTDKQAATSSLVSPFYQLPATDLVNLNLDWREVAGRPVDLSFFVTNLTNKKYPVSTVGAWFTGGFESLLVGQPRMWGVRLRYTFGS